MHSLKAFIIMALVASSSAATIYLRGSSPECTSARVRIVTALNDASGSVKRIKDPTIASAARNGITQASSGIGQIAKSIFSLQGPSAVGSSTIKAGLEATARALANGDMSDTAVVAAQISIQKAQQAGRDVVLRC